MDYPGKIIRKTAVTPSQTSASGVWTVDDALQAVKTNTWPVAGVPNPISRSLRFNSADSASLNRTPASASNRKTWTWSGWVKRSALSAGHCLFSAANGTSEFQQIKFDETNNTIDYILYTPSGIVGRLITTQVFRDVSSWYHIVAVWDTANATAGNRMRLYVNGSEINDFSTDTQPTLDLLGYVNNTVDHRIGETSAYGTNYFAGYLAEINFIDGQALTPSSFGMTDPQTGAWIPIKYTGTYGTNGFYLNFKDNSSTSALGYDYSGNGNNWTTNNFSVTAGAGNDSLVDVPTPWIAYNTTGDVGGVVRGNYCTLNPLDKGSAATLTNGNLDIGSASNPNNNCRGTFGMSSGKWYFEFVITSAIGGVPAFGIGSDTASLTSNFSGDLYLYLSNGTKAVNGVETAYGATFTQNDVIGVAFDADNNSITFYKNNSSQGAITGVTSGLTWRPFVHASITATITSNFGQRPFAYTPPAGFLSLCTTNLPTPTIGATSTTQAGKYMNVVLWSGTGGARTISGLGFQPDWVWGKGRSGAATYPNLIWDVLRGTNINLVTNTTDAEFNAATSSSNGGLGTSASDGFTIVAGSSSADNLNASSPASTYVGWAWKANGAGSSNTAGSITSTVSANTTAGFSVVTATAQSSGVGTFGHGLGVAPSMVIIKGRGSASSWGVYHVSTGNGGYLLLNSTSAFTTDLNFMNNTSPSSTVFTLGASYAGYGTFVTYCFAPVAGYSAFGSYTGNGSADGPFVYTGFRPRWIMIKGTGSANWCLIDSVRSPYNVTAATLFADQSQAEATDLILDIDSNGFKIRNTFGNYNTSSASYIYAAFAEFPFKFSNAR